MQLADQTLAATGFITSQILLQAGIDERMSVTFGRAQLGVAVRSLDGGTVEDKADQQQTEYSRQRRGSVIRSGCKATGHGLNCYTRFGPMGLGNCSFPDSQIAILLSAAA